MNRRPVRNATLGIKSMVPFIDVLDCISAASDAREALTRCSRAIEWMDTFRDPRISGWPLDSVGSRSIRTDVDALHHMHRVLRALAVRLPLT